MHRPDYDNSIVNLVATLAAARGVPPGDYPVLPQLAQRRLSGRPVVLLVLDGLGYQYLCRYPSSALYQQLDSRLTSVFPTTTATAVSALALGVPAQQHAISGWFTYFRELGCVAAPLPFVPRGGGSCFTRFGIEAEQLLDASPLLNRFAVPTSVISPNYIADSTYSRALFADTKRRPYHDLDGFFGQLTEAVDAHGDSFVWGYWTELDAMAHSCGMASDQVAAHFEELDRGFQAFMDSIAGSGALVLVTADHGLIDTAADRRICLSHHPELEAMLRLPLCGEPRAAYAYLKPGVLPDFDAYVRERLGERLQVFDSDELVAVGWFGRGEPSQRFQERIGERVLLPRDNWIVKDRLLQEAPFDQIGVHGGLSDEELYVPLIVAEA